MEGVENGAEPGRTPNINTTASTPQGAATTDNSSSAEQIRAMSELYRSLDDSDPDMKRAMRVALAGMCLSYAQAIGVSFQNSVNNQQQLYITSNAAAARGAVEMFRRDSAASVQRVADIPINPPMIENFNLLLEALRNGKHASADKS